MIISIKIFDRDVKKLKVNKNRSYITDLLRYPSLPFHIYDLAKLEAFSEPCQTPKVDHFAITFLTVLSH